MNAEERDPQRDLLRHALATLVYRAGKVIEGMPKGAGPRRELLQGEHHDGRKTMIMPTPSSSLRGSTWLLSGVMLAAFLAVALPVHAAEPSPDQVAVAATVHAFHAALAKGDSVTVLQLLADDAVILEAGGLETRAEYRAHHLPEDIAFAQAVPTTQTEPTVIVLGDVAWVASTGRTTGIFHDRPIDAAGAELVVLSRGSDGWKIRAVHWSSRSLRTK